jgi:hypothetical protein
MLYFSEIRKKEGIETGNKQGIIILSPIYYKRYCILAVYEKVNNKRASRIILKYCISEI